MKPLVSFIVPIYNDSLHVEKMLNSILAQTYPLERIEVIFADGNSTDGSVEIIKKIQKKFIKDHKNKQKYPLIKIFKNPSKNTAIGRNICVMHSKGKYLFNYSSHAYADVNLVSTLVGKLENKPNKVMGIGVSSNPLDTKLSFVGKCIQTVFATAFGGVSTTDQNIALHEEMPVRSVAFTAYRRELFDLIGNFDEDLWCGQDGEFNLRLNKAGYVLLYTPDSFVSLQKRESVKKFWRQMYRYGLAASIRIKKHPDSYRPYYTIPSAFVIGLSFLFLGTILSLINPFTLTAHITSRTIISNLKICICSYILISFISAFIRSKNFLITLASPLFYFIIHAGYGIGYLRGLFNKKF